MTFWENLERKRFLIAPNTHRPGLCCWILCFLVPITYIQGFIGHFIQSTVLFPCEIGKSNFKTVHESLYQYSIFDDNGCQHGRNSYILLDFRISFDYHNGQSQNRPQVLPNSINSKTPSKRKKVFLFLVYSFLVSYLNLSPSEYIIRKLQESAKSDEELTISTYDI